jgi:hypothetical protein
MENKPLLNHRVQPALGAAILASLVVGAISYRSMVACTESERSKRHTQVSRYGWLIKVVQEGMGTGTKTNTRWPASPDGHCRCGDR